MLTVRTWLTHLLLVLICLLPCASCGHRQGSVPAAVAPTVAPATQPIMAAVLFTTKTYHCPTADIQFDYPSEWQPDAATTSLFTVTAPTTSHCCLNLDVPTLPWHPRGMITVNMVADGYERDLKKNQIHDAVQEEACSVSVPDAQAKRITTCGHENGKTLIDMAVILIHADRVYILSTDTDDQGRDSARKTLDCAIASLKWTK
jgi:hypothetical protein